MDALSLLQWPAMAVTVGATWLVGSNREGRRQAGFWLFLGSNALWAAWGLYDDAPALVMLQVALAVMNIRGARRARREQEAADKDVPGMPVAAGPIAQPKEQSR